MANSKALIKVKNYTSAGSQNPISEGIFLSNNQIITLGNAFKNLGSVDDALFMIGKDLVEGRVIQTIEILSYENVSVSKKVFNKGHLIVNIGKTEPNSPMAVCINNNVPQNQTYTLVAPAIPVDAVVPAAATLVGIIRGSQRTRPLSINI